MCPVLLVEGPTDVDFFTALLKRIELGDRIDIRPPRSFNQPNTVTVYPKLLDTLLMQLENGQLHGLGIVADADHTSGGGFQARWQAITTKLAAHGYRIPDPPRRAWLGTVFRHPDGLPKVGLWLMPDHQHNGMLEDLLLASIVDTPEQQQLLSQARRTISKLPVRLFTDHQESKATVYSWLAWQRRPGQGLDVALGTEALLDQTKPPMKGLVKWLEQTFEPRV